MYNHNLDGWMFKAMKDYNYEQETEKGRKSKLSGKLLAGVGGALVSAGEKMKGHSQPGTHHQPKANPAS
jgi:hypothetical protein